MTTALTVYLASAAATTIATADQLYITSGTPSTTQSYSKIGNNVTGYGEIESQANNANTWAASGSIGSPTGKGFLWDVTTLEGQQIVSGNWTPSIRLNAAQGASAPQAGTLTGDLYMRAYKRSSGGTYTLIASCSLTGQTLNSTFTTYTLNAASGSATTFSTGDKLYLDIWFNCTGNTNANANQGIRLNRLSTDTTTFTGDTNSQFVTPGYQPAVTNNAMTFEDDLSAADVLLVSVSVLATEALTATESLLCTHLVLPVDALTSSDVSAMQSWPVDVVPASDTLLVTNALAALESLAGSESVLVATSAAVIETLTASELLTRIGTYTPVEALASSDSVLGITALLPADLLTASDALLKSASYFAVDALSIFDSISTPSVTNNAMASEDDLVAADAFLVVCSCTLADVLPASETLLAQESSLFIEANSVSIVRALQSWGIDALAVSDGIQVTYAYQTTDAISVSENLTLQGVYGTLEGMSVSDALLSGVGYNVLESGVISDGVVSSNGSLFLDSLSATDGLLAAGSASWTELLSATLLFARSTNALFLLFVENLAASDECVTLDQVLFVVLDAATDTAAMVSFPRSNAIVYARKGTALVEVRG